MKLIANRQLLDVEEVQAGRSFDCPDDRAMELIRLGVARNAAPPKVIYERTAPEQNEAADGKKEAAIKANSSGAALVSCICVTRNRREWLAKAIRFFRDQAYRNKELLILADGEDVKDLVPVVADIHLVHIEEGRTIGEKRNFANSLARGEFIAHWDDDDWSAPQRLSEQMARIADFSVTGYSSMDFVGDDARWHYTGDHDYALGTSLLYRKSWWKSHPFTAKQVGEDGDFVREARFAGQLIAVPGGGMMTATIHPGNTSPRQLIGREWQRLSEAV